MSLRDVAREMRAADEQLRKAHDNHQDLLTANVRRQLGAKEMLPVDVRSAHVIVAELGGKQKTVASSVISTVRSRERLVRVAGLRALQAELHRRGLPGVLDDDAEFNLAVGVPGKTAIARQNRAAARLASATRDRVEMAVRRVAAAHGTNGQAIAAAREASRASDGLVRRIGYTESARAYNEARTNGLVRVFKAVPALRKRWVEHVSDAGAPLNAKVAADSLVLHGQVTRPNSLFEMPRDDRVPAKLWGKKWKCPPNRPHDRGVVMPWMPGWKDAAWEVQNGARIVVR